MKFALIGYGKMGKAIERIAIERGHTIVSVIDVENRGDFASGAFRSADVAIEFTTPETAVDNYMQCFAAGIPVVSGTTGWLSRFEEIRQHCAGGKHTFFYASNFSMGVNIFFALNRYLAKIMNRFPEYEAKLTETHHIHKADAPSGTAITLAEDIIENIDHKKRWRLADETELSSDLCIHAIREGETPGRHEVSYESDADYISICHNAKDRRGFALGAVVAAEFTAGRKGFLGMSDMLAF
ncbi:MAG: 4-hydroxy-tetrahydrodipicolinate reductase [Tannerellaceae bacterium]|jgi:4-hydroxy-tetrahydrodipicolinate reductase|nr:4-hydroxy-tetrahydrodipicolinate reductase [Tannerellaceae bacterium]